MIYLPLSATMRSIRNKWIPLVVGLIIGLNVDYFYLAPNPCTGKSGTVPIFSDANDDANVSTQGQIMSASPHPSSNQNTEDFLSKVKVLCWVLVAPQKHKHIVYIQETWGKRCDKTLFMSTKADPQYGTIGLKTVEGYNWLWDKTKLAFKHVWQNHRDEYDWFMKTDMDTFVMVDNLKFMLKDYNSSRPIYFGYPFSTGPGTNATYASGGSGYVLSKEALRRFVNIGLRNPKLCYPNHSGPEDKEMGKCLHNVGVKLGDSRDEQGLHRFMAVGLHHLLFKNFSLPAWYYEMMVYPQERGMECCSDRPISFHYVNILEMYKYEYLLYHARPVDVTQLRK